MSAWSGPIWTANLSRPPQPDRNRFILALAGTTRLSFAEIGAEVGCSRNAVAGVIDRDRKKTKSNPAIEPLQTLVSRRGRPGARFPDAPPSPGPALPFIPRTRCSS